MLEVVLRAVLRMVVEVVLEVVLRAVLRMVVEVVLEVVVGAVLGTMMGAVLGMVAGASLGMMVGAAWNDVGSSAENNENDDESRDWSENGVVVAVVEIVVKALVLDNAEVQDGGELHSSI